LHRRAGLAPLLFSGKLQRRKRRSTTALRRKGIESPSLCFGREGGGTIQIFQVCHIEIVVNYAKMRMVSRQTMQDSCLD